MHVSRGPRVVVQQKVTDADPSQVRTWNPLAEETPGSQKGPPTSSQPSELAPPPVLPRGVCGLDTARRTTPGRVVPRTCSPRVCADDDVRSVPTVPCWSEGTWGPSHKRHPAKAQLGLWQAVGRSRPPALSPVPTASSGAIQPTAGRTAALVRWFME